MQYAKDGSIYTGYELRRMYPNISFAPNTPAELGYSEYVPPEAPVVEEVPFALSRFQTMAILHIEGHMTIITSMMAQADPITKLAWEEAQEFRRTSPSIAAVAQALGWSEDYLDDLFIRGARIEA